MSLTQRKRGHNRGIAAARKEQRRIEAEERNARTPPEKRRAHRRAQTLHVEVPEMDVERVETPDSVGWHGKTKKQKKRKKVRR